MCGKSSVYHITCVCKSAVSNHFSTRELRFTQFSPFECIMQCFWKRNHDTFKTKKGEYGLFMPSSVCIKISKECLDQYVVMYMFWKCVYTCQLTQNYPNKINGKLQITFYKHAFTAFLLFFQIGDSVDALNSPRDLSYHVSTICYN